MSCSCKATAGLTIATAIVVCITLVSVPGKPARAGDGAAFVGGLIGGHLLTNMANRSERRTRAAEYEAYQSQQRYQQPAPAPAPAQPAAQSLQQKLDTLDQLAAGGYISKEEYQRRRQAILDSL